MPSDEIELSSDRDEVVLHLRGRLDRRLAARLYAEIPGLLETASGEVQLDLGEATDIDVAGLAGLQELKERCAARDIELVPRRVPDGVAELKRYMDERSSDHAATPREQPGLVSIVGAWALDEATRARGFVRFVGECVLGSRAATARRWIDPFYFRHALRQFQRAGADASPLVIGLSMLMGTIMAFQSAHEISQLASSVLVARAVTVSSTREMGPLLTAVLVAGRSGSAFAVELGTMRINREIDALTVMGFDVIRLLVLPRTLALLVATPLLVVLADAAGILGGLGVGTAALGLPPSGFIHEVELALAAPDIYSGLLKGAAFGLGIGVIGCFHGLRAGPGAESVGTEATGAVVGGILFVIFTDALLSGIFHVFGW